jgi:hypothetical protein
MCDLSNNPSARQVTCRSGDFDQSSMSPTRGAVKIILITAAALRQFLLP